MDLDGAATELYGLDPDEFMAARTALVAQARAAGDRALASAVGALRKPTRSAWLVNLLARDAPDRLRQLDELADRMAAAHQALDMATLRALGAERQRLIDAATAQAVAAGSDRGYQATEAVRAEVGQTLAAAIADPESRAEARAGRVVKVRVYSGFGFPLAVSPSPPGTGPASPDAVAEEPSVAADAVRRASESARRRAQEAVDAATAALVEARATLKDARSADAEAHQRLDRAAHEVADLRAELRAAESAELAARQSANESADRLHEALGAVQQAEQTLSEAARALGAAG